MAKPLLMRKKAKIVALIIFILALAIVMYSGLWWPGIMLAVGFPLAILQYLQGRMFDVAITLFVFVGAFITVQFNIKWEIFLPVLFGLGGIYIFFREWIYSRPPEEEEFKEDKDESSSEEE